MSAVLSKGRYNIDGVVLPSVTEVLGMYGIGTFDGIPEHILRNAADRGDHVHQICNDIDNGLPEWWEGSDLQGYAEGYKQFRADYGWEPIHTEKPMVHPVYRYGGTLDYLGRCKRWVMKRLSAPHLVLDIKSGVEIDLKYWSLQTGGYMGLAMVEEPDMVGSMTRAALKLRPDGRYRLYEFTDHLVATRLFWGLVSAYHYEVKA